MNLFPVVPDSTLPHFVNSQLRVGQEGKGGGGGGVGGEFAKIPKFHPNISKINGSIVYCIPEIQRM